PDQALRLKAVEQAGDRPAIRPDVLGQFRGEDSIAAPEAVEDVELRRRDLERCGTSFEFAAQRLPNAPEVEEKARLVAQVCRQIQYSEKQHTKYRTRQL